MHPNTLHSDKCLFIVGMGLWRRDKGFRRAGTTPMRSGVISSHAGESSLSACGMRQGGND